MLTSLSSFAEKIALEETAALVAAHERFLAKLTVRIITSALHLTLVSSTNPFEILRVSTRTLGLGFPLNIIFIGNSTPPVQNYIKLILASNNVTRPFLVRNKVLVEYCRELVKQYNSHTTKRAANLGNVTL